MSKQRDNMFLRSGLLVGFGTGLCVGLLLLIFSFTILLHHMFIIGIRWTAPALLILLVALPVTFIATGVLASKKARSAEQ
jgi:Zn-dependent membrane protease YugP